MRTHRPAAVATIVATFLAAGCDSLDPVEPFRPTTDRSQLFMSLTLDHHAVNLSSLAPWNELQLTATPRNANGEVMAGLPAPTFRSTDTTRVRVTETGLLQAQPRAGTANVIAEIRTSGNVVRADTTAVRVTVHTSTPPKMVGSVSIQPPTPEDAIWAMNVSPGIAGQAVFQQAGLPSPRPRLVTRIVAEDGTTMSGLTLDYRAIESDIASVTRTGAVRPPTQPGTVQIVASGWIYGRAIADTATFTATLPFFHGVTAEPGTNGGPPTVSPRTVTIRPGGLVTFLNSLPDSIRVTFDDPSKAEVYAPVCEALGATHPAFCTGGDIANFQGPTAGSDVLPRARMRQFTQPGRYGFRIEPLGVTGTIIVEGTIE